MNWWGGGLFLKKKKKKKTEQNKYSTWKLRCRKTELCTYLLGLIYKPSPEKERKKELES
jgi:hypothetical protein